MKTTLCTAAVLALAAAGFAAAAQAATIYIGDSCPVPESEYAE